MIRLDYLLHCTSVSSVFFLFFFPLLSCSYLLCFLASLLFCFLASLQSHLDYICAKVAQRLALLRRIKSFLFTDARLIFYRAMVAPLYEYGGIIWGDVSKHIAKRITTLQKYAGRIILVIKNPREINSTELFKKLNWLPFSDQITF